MEIDYKGANCVVIKDKNALIIVDPTPNATVKDLQNPEAVVLATQPNFAPAEDTVKSFIIDMPGEYEHKDVSVRGIAVRAHLAEDEKAKDAVMYRIETMGIAIAVIGHTVSPLTEDEVEELGKVDIVIIPVGGGGYTLDADDAGAIIRQISPSVVIPTHFNDGQTKYEVPQEDLTAFEKEMGNANIEKQSVYKIKADATFPAATTTYELSRTR